MIRVGPAGWSYHDWEGRVYPDRKPAGFHPLAFLARYVDCIEINSSFYATPRADYARRWVRLVDDRPSFRFVAKLEQVFTHAAGVERERLDRTAEAFLAGVEPLRAAGRLAALLVQFPHSFRASRAAWERLERIRGWFGHLELVLEVRHLSWLEEPWLAQLDRAGWSLAAIDLPAAADHPPACPPPIGPIGYHRLHGRNRDAWFRAGAGRDERYDYLYDDEELEQLLRITRRIATDREQTYAITNNHFAGKAVANALELLAALRDDPPLAPAEVVRSFPRLASRVRVEGQGSLF
ncbi:MAG: DUF72 domain-containing protein [Planctomycetota bacterium]